MWPASFAHCHRSPPGQVPSRQERGAATASFVIAFPLLLLVFMALIQWGLYFHAQALVDAAAQDGTRAAQNADGTASQGRQVAEDLLADAGRSGLLREVRVDVSESAGEIRTTVRGQAPSLVPLPGFDATVEGSSVGPKERFVPQGEP